MKNSIKFLPIFLTTLLVSLFSCQEEDSVLSSLEGTVSFGDISLEFSPMGTAGSRLAGVSPWVHIFPNSAEIVFTNIVTEEEFVLEYNPNDFTTPYSISLPFGAYEFISKVEAGIFSDFLPFEAIGEFVLDSQNLEISLNGKSDYGLITVKNQYLDEASVTNGSTVSQLVLPDGGTHRYKYVKGGTATTLKITESTQGSTISKEINVAANTHYNFVLKPGEGTATITDLTIDPFELVDEEIIIGSNAKFFDENGTIKCPKASPGDKGQVNGKTYEAVDRALLIQRRDEGAELSCVCTSLVKDMSLLFGQYSIYSEFNQDISSWDVSNVTNMEYMFNGAEKFNQPIGNWDVSNVKSMRRMFSGESEVTNEFNQDISSWDVSNVVDMIGMFSLSYFNQNIGNWDVSNVKNMGGMFAEAWRFNQPIGNWDVGNVQTMQGMFWASSFNQPICNWNVSNVTNMRFMFEWSSFNQPIADWDVSKVSSMEGMFSWATNFNQPIGNWNVENVSNMGEMFSSARNFNQDLSSWCVRNILTEPDGFSDGSLSPGNKPIWGTCPD